MGIMQTKYSAGGTNPCQCLVESDDSTRSDPVFTRTCPATTHREFAQGHDAKLKAVYVTAYRLGIETITVDGELVNVRDAAAERGWEKFLTPLKGRGTALQMAEVEA